MEYRVIESVEDIEHFSRYQLEGDCGMVELIHSRFVVEGKIVRTSWTFVTHSVAGGLGNAEMCPTLKRAAWCHACTIFEDDLSMRIIQSGQYRTAVVDWYAREFGTGKK